MKISDRLPTVALIVSIVVLVWSVVDLVTACTHTPVEERKIGGDTYLVENRKIVGMIPAGQRMTEKVSQAEITRQGIAGTVSYKRP